MTVLAQTNLDAPSLRHAPAILSFDPRQRDRAALDAATDALMRVLSRELNMTEAAVTEALEVALAMVNAEIKRDNQTQEFAP